MRAAESLMRTIKMSKTVIWNFTMNLASLDLRLLDNRHDFECQMDTMADPFGTAAALPNLGRFGFIKTMC